MTTTDDTLSGNSGSNVIQGNNGNDSVIGNNGNDQVYGNTGNDVVKGGAGNDLVSGGNGNDWVAGGQGNDIVIGGRGNDIVSGGTGDDLLFGGQPNGGAPLVAEKDILSGGSGRDKFYLYDAGSQRNFYEGFGASDYADIIDFTSEDRIVLGAGSGYTFSMAGAHTQIFNNGDLVAVVRNASSDLVSSHVDYIGTAPAV